jgi:peptidoglycan/xylan/chitin deacetylase (PgdA/CDA1 family)
MNPYHRSMRDLGGSVRDQRVKRRIEAILAAHMPPRSELRRTVVLCYHSVHPSNPIRSATPSDFERQIEWVQEHCEIIPFRTIAALPHPSIDGKPLVAITFDDGYEDNHRYAFPILAARGVLATLFVTTGLLDGADDVIAGLSSAWGVPADDVQGMSWSQVSEMHIAGFDIGAHTRTHPVLTRLDEADAINEITSSRTAIEDHLGAAVRSFAYPFGKPREHVSERMPQIVAGLGFESAATVLYRGVRHDDDPMSIPRFPITRDSMDIFSGKIRGRLDAIGLWQTYAPPWLGESARRILGEPRGAR